MDKLYSHKIRRCKNCNNNILNGDPFIISKQKIYFICTKCNNYIYDYNTHLYYCSNSKIKKYIDMTYFCTKDCHTSYIFSNKY